jgi:hypothetical protein
MHAAVSIHMQSAERDGRSNQGRLDGMEATRLLSVFLILLCFPLLPTSPSRSPEAHSSYNLPLDFPGDHRTTVQLMWPRSQRRRGYAGLESAAELRPLGLKPVNGVETCKSPGNVKPRRRRTIDGKRLRTATCGHCGSQTRFLQTMKAGVVGSIDELARENHE